MSCNFSSVEVWAAMRLIQATSVSGKISSTKSDVKGGDSSAFGRAARSTNCDVDPLEEERQRPKSQQSIDDARTHSAVRAAKLRSLDASPP
jgi:hypothetical protein